MNRIVVVVLIAAMLVLGTVGAALAAGGAGPSKGTKTGEFLSANPVDNTAVFRQSGKTETMTVTLGTGLSADALPIARKVLINMDDHSGANVVSEVSVMFIGMTIEKILALLIIGLIGGLLSGFIGSGGAFVLTPAMMSLGAPGAVAVASNMCHKFPKAMVGAYKRFKYGQVDLKLGVTMAISAIVGVQIGIQIQKYILSAYGNAGSNLYVSVVFVVVLLLVGGYVLYDAMKLKSGGSEEPKVSKLALRLQKIELWPMMNFDVAGVRMSAWITIPIGLFTGMLAATIAVGGFIGVPGMIYVVGTTAIVASATELVVAFIMGLWGSVQWGLSGLIDIRMVLLILAASLFGVQLGAIGTTYVKDYTVKLVMAATMLIVAVSRGAKIPIYLTDLGVMKLDETVAVALNQLSFWSLIAALGVAGIIITGAMIKGMAAHKIERAQAQAHGKI